MSLKNSIKKSVASFIAISLVYSNCYLCGLGLTRVIAQDIKEPSIELNLENAQYVQFKEEIKPKVEELQENEEQQSTTIEQVETPEQVEVVKEEIVEEEPQFNSGVAIQTKIQTGITQEETQLPILKTEMSVVLPAINGFLPERANVVDSDTLLSTGEENNNRINQNYDASSGLLTVSWENEEANTNYNQESKDVFEIIYIYPAEAYIGNDEEIALQYAVDLKMFFQTENGEITVQNAKTFDIVEKENKGNILTFGLTELKTDLDNKIHKGFMYSNVENETSYETEFKTASTLTVLNSSIRDKMIMSLEDNKFVLNNEDVKEEVLIDGNVIYKSTQLSKSEFDKILGQDGSLEILNGEELLATVKYIEVSDEEQIVKKLAVIYSDEDMKILEPEETTIAIEYKKEIKVCEIFI